MPSLRLTTKLLGWAADPVNAVRAGAAALALALVVSGCSPRPDDDPTDPPPVTSTPDVTTAPNPSPPEPSEPPWADDERLEIVRAAGVVDAGYAELPGASAQVEMWGTFEGRVVFVKVGPAELVTAGEKVADEAPIGDHPVVRVAADGPDGGTALEIACDPGMIRVVSLEALPSEDELPDFVRGSSDAASARPLAEKLVGAGLCSASN